MKTNKLPGKTASYVTRMTDNRIWDRFELRTGDVIVSTPPKCGTTWTQALVLSLIFGKPGMDKNMDDLSVWLDPGFRDQTALKAMFEAQSHRRCIKTHTPLDGIHYDPNCTYIAVYRHPVDAHFSMRKHAFNLNTDLFEGRFPEDSSNSFAFFLETSAPNCLADGITLEAIIHHFRSFKSFVNLPNVHMFHYADMRRNLIAHTQKMAELLGYKYDDQVLEHIAASLQFETMQANAKSNTEHSAQSSTTFKDPAAFFDSASSRKWVGKLTDEDLAVFSSKLHGLVSNEEARWLEDGGEFPI